jgi:uracil-DNA glycosylase
MNNKLYKCIMKFIKITNLMAIDSKNYNYDDWQTHLKKYNKINLRDLLINYDWNDFFNYVKNDEFYQKIESELTTRVSNGEIIFPYPELLFYSLNFISPQEIKVIVIGQDPYIKMENNVPQATGASFSVPYGLSIPSSLSNIYSNMLKYKIIDKIPSHGNLFYLMSQGVFFINASLTVKEGEPNSHKNLWSQFTQELFSWLDDKLSKCVIVLWGKDALNQKWLFEKEDYEFVISSHPSGNSCHNKLGSYPAFNDINQFQEINNKLIKLGHLPLVPLF